MSAPCCDNCRFYRIDPDDSTYENPRFGCHRYPPVAHSDPDLKGYVEWPPVVGVEWCGEHQPGGLGCRRLLAEYRLADLEKIFPCVEPRLRHATPGSPEAR